MRRMHATINKQHLFPFEGDGAWKRDLPFRFIITTIIVVVSAPGAPTNFSAYVIIIFISCQTKSEFKAVHPPPNHPTIFEIDSPVFMFFGYKILKARFIFVYYSILVYTKVLPTFYALRILFHLGANRDCPPSIRNGKRDIKGAFLEVVFTQRDKALILKVLRNLLEYAFHNFTRLPMKLWVRTIRKAPL